MTDDELRRFLQNGLGGRRLSEDDRERLLGRLHRRPWRAAAVVAASVLAGVAALVVTLPRSGRLPAEIEMVFRGHELGKVERQAVASDTVREITQKIKDATGLEIQLPGLRDAGFSQLEAHCCQETGAAHVIYANSWNKLSCFIFEAGKFPLEGGTPVEAKGGSVDSVCFRKGSMSAVAVKEGGIVKVWVSDLRSDQLAAIAVDAEEKRYRLKTTVLTAPNEAMFKPMGAAVMSIPGVEDVEMEPAKFQANVRFDPQRVTAEGIVAKLVLSDMDVHWRDEDGSR
jgi:hypothetical protein